MRVLAYDNRGGYTNRGPGGPGGPGGRGSGGPGGPGRFNSLRELPPEIKPEKVPEDYVDAAETVMRKVMQGNRRITTSKIRNLMSLITEIYNVENLRKDDTLQPESVTGILRMRVRTAYEYGRDPETRTFVNEAKLLQYLKGIGNSRKNLMDFAHYMEALVAYHRYLGGREN